MTFVAPARRLHSAAGYQSRTFREAGTLPLAARVSDCGRVRSAGRGASGPGARRCGGNGNERNAEAPRVPDRAGRGAARRALGVAASKVPDWGVVFVVTHSFLSCAHVGGRFVHRACS
jgi:hypothetical protein